MSVSLLVLKGKTYDYHNSEVIIDKPVSVQSVWNNVWEKAIADCGVKQFVCCGRFSADDIPCVLMELNSILRWVDRNGGKDTDYISNRIKGLKNLLSNYIIAEDNSDYWFDLW